jgi:hypothetical protein
MPFDTLTRRLVALGKTLAGPMAITVQHAPAGKPNGFGSITPGTAVPRECLINEHRRLYRQPDGTQVMSSHRLAFLENVVVGDEDVITFDDGSTGPILDVQGLRDPNGGRYTTVVVMGVEGRASL